MKNESNGLLSWFGQNAWAIILVLAGGLITFSLMQQRVAALEAKALEIETKVASYPSQDWFELKFQVLEKEIEELSQEVRDHGDLTGNGNSREK